MTNEEKWQLYTQDFISPQVWIDYGWYFIITSCLQRRVWFYGEDGLPLYCNQYALLIGPPGAGKGLVLGEITRFLKYHRYEKGAKVTTNIGNEYPPLFPVGADSITFEELLRELAGSARAIITPDKKPYIHTSYVFPLEELSSLFKRKTEDVIKFLLNAYDCKDFEYKTKHQGKDLIRKLCLSLIAGTQPDFLKEASDAKLFGQGFASRTLFLFENKPRFDRFHLSNFSADQLRCRADLLDWIKKLSTLYGQIQYSQETYAWLEDWFAKVHSKNAAKAGHRMQDYYSREKVIMQKLATAMHFSENLSMTIPLATFQRAVKWLEQMVPQMEAGLNMGGKNPLANYVRRMLVMIRTSIGGVRRRDIILEFGADINLDEIESCLRTLVLGYGVSSKKENNETVYYIE